MSGEYDALGEAFRIEAEELLSELENSLLELEKDPRDMEAVSSVFRTFHTLKGSGAMCGFDEVSRFTHRIETVYDLVRDGKIAVDKGLIDLTLSAADLLRSMVRSRGQDAKAIGDRGLGLLASFRRLAPGHLLPEPPEAGHGGKAIFAPDVAGRQVTYRIGFRPSPSIFLNGTNPLLLLDELRGLGECSVAALTDGIPALHDLDPESCYTSWEVVLTTDRGIDAVRDIFIFVEDNCDVTIDVMDDGGDPADRAPVKPSGVEATPDGQEAGREIGRARRNRESMSSLRVSSRKLDKLVNLVGELVTVQARLSRISFVRNDPELISIAEEVERLVADLRGNAMDIRMMPIGAIFGVFKRLVRDLSEELGKEVELVAEGGETELDKTVLEKLNDPLVHLIRNSIDHGIESPGARERAGKPGKGAVRLAAAHSGDHVMIRITDDGAGLDTGAIIGRAVEKGLVGPDDRLTEKEIFSLIFAPGFTTARDVTSISGRGVGMDVVKRTVESLSGSIHVESRRGVDTAITLVLPLTLAIIEGLLVRVGEERFVLPLLSVEECVELTRGDAERRGGRHIANIRGQAVPYIRLREQFAIGGEPPAVEQIVVVREYGRTAGFVVDEVVGQHQTVIKTLGRVLRDIEGNSGATILGDGSVALITDIQKLLTIAEEEEVEKAGRMLR